jgi:hypothetical protein
MSVTDADEVTKLSTKPHTNLKINKNPTHAE